MIGNGENFLSMDTQWRLLANSNGFSRGRRKVSEKVVWVKGFIWGLIVAFSFWFVFICKVPW